MLLKPSTLNHVNLNQLGLVDATPTTSPYSITNIPLDDGWAYSPAKILPGGQGTMAVTDGGNGSKVVTLTITWTGPKGTITYITGTVLGSHR